MDLTFSAVGLLVGTLIGATGVGGGSLMTPILLTLGIAPAHAVGTDLLFAAVTKGVGTGLHGMNQSVSWKIVGRLASGSLIASLTMLWVMHRFLDPAALGPLIRGTLGVALLLTSAAILLQPVLRRTFRKGKTISQRPTAPSHASASADPGYPDALLQEERASETRAGVAWPTILVGAILGALVTVTSVGAGAVGVMVLMALYPQVRSVRVVGTDVAHAVPLTLVAGLGHAGMGTVQWGLLGALLLGSIPGIFVGTQCAFRLPERHLKQALAVLLLAVGGQMAFSA